MAIRAPDGANKMLLSKPSTGHRYIFSYHHLYIGPHLHLLPQEVEGASRYSEKSFPLISEYEKFEI